MNSEDHDVVETPEAEAPERAAESEESKPTLRLEVSPDGMAASLYGAVPPETEPGQIHDLFRQRIRAVGVTYGLDLAQVRAAMGSLASGKSLEGVVIARGTPPTPGRDAKIVPRVDLKDSRIFRVKSDGKIAFDHAPEAAMVAPGDLLATLTPALPGKPGKNVYGKEAEAPHPRRRALQPGEGVEVSKNGLEVRATVKGMVARPAPDLFEVLVIMDVKDDLNIKGQSLEFPGLVRIAGTVTKGHKVRAKSLQAEALEPGCEVMVESDLTIKGGAMGAKIAVGGTLTVKFVRDCQIACQKDAVIESEIVNSNLKCGGGVRLTLDDGRIVNSTVAAIHGVSVGEVISSGTNATMIRLGVRPEFEKKIHGLRQRVENFLKERDVIQEALIAQKEELANIEDEMREMLAALKDPAQAANRDNLMSQVGMIRPMRETLQEGIASGTERVVDLEIRAGRVQDEIDIMAGLTPKDTVWLDVRKGAEATTEVRGPHVSFTLDRPKRSFSMGEAMVKKPGVEGGAQPDMRLIPLRPSHEQAMVTLAKDLDR